MRDFFKKIGNTKEIFNAKMGTIKDRNGMDLKEAEEIRLQDIKSTHRNPLHSSTQKNLKTPTENY